MSTFTSELTFGPWTLGIFDPGNGGTPHRTILGGASIVSTGYSQDENTTIGTTIGTLSVVNHPSGSSGWSFAETLDTDNVFTITGTSLKNSAVFNYEAATFHDIVITASKSGQLDIVQTLRITVGNVYETTLSNVGLDGVSWVVGTPTSGLIIGWTSGSTLSTIGSLPAGLSLDLSAHTWSWSGSGSVSTGAFTIHEIHPDAAPHDTIQNWDITENISSPTAPVLNWTSSSSELNPTFNLTEIVEGDIVEVQVDDNSDFSSLFDSDINTIDSSEALAGALTFINISSLSAGTTYYVRARYQRGGLYSDWSNTETKAMVAPLSAPVLTWTSGAGVLNPVFASTLIEEGDNVEIQIDDTSAFTSLYGNDTNVIDAGEAAAGSITFSTPTLLSTVTYYARVRYQRGGVFSDWSNTVSKTMSGAGVPSAFGVSDWSLPGGSGAAVPDPFTIGQWSLPSSGGGSSPTAPDAFVLADWSVA